MPSAAPAYRYDAAPRRAPRPDVRVVRARRTQNVLSPQFVHGVRLLALAVVLFAILACVRIGLTSATVTTTVVTEQLAGQVSAMQAYAANLEVEESSLANPSHMRSMAASQLGMAPAAHTAVIDLERDIVLYDQDGNLSLSRSLSSPVQG